MPWCSHCDRFLSPPTVNPDGTCPMCGRPVEVNRPAATTGGRPEGEPGVPEAEEELPPVPFHLKALGAATALYLGWRLVQGISWVVHRLG